MLPLLMAMQKEIIMVNVFNQSEYELHIIYWYELTLTITLGATWQWTSIPAGEWGGEDGNLLLVTSSLKLAISYNSSDLVVF